MRCRSVSLSCKGKINHLIRLPNLFWWKKINFKNLSDDIQHESSLAAELTKYDEQTLLNAKYWLDLQMKRAEARVSYFFGEKTAALALLGMAYLCTKEFGGLHWLGESLKAGLSLGNIGNTALLGIIAFILGISIGALFLKHIAYRYRFQIELIDIALRGATLQPAATEQQILAAKIHTRPVETTRNRAEPVAGTQAIGTRFIKEGC